VYDKHRPSACAQFSCALLSAVDAGRVNADEARAIVRDTIRQRDRVRTGDAAPEDLAARVRAHFLPNW
jgi:hypothetical protein